MRIPGKTERNTSTGNDVDFDRYDWEVVPDLGWSEAVVLLAEETESKAGNPMIKLTFGLEPEDRANPNAVGGRVAHWVPMNFKSKLDEFLSTFFPGKADSEEDFEINPKAVMFMRCAVLVAEDAGYERRDGKKSFRVEKLTTVEAAAAVLGAVDTDEDLF